MVICNPPRHKPSQASLCIQKTTSFQVIIYHYRNNHPLPTIYLEFGILLLDFHPVTATANSHYPLLHYFPVSITTLLPPYRILIV
jgi:hypothetical protein